MDVVGDGRLGLWERGATARNQPRTATANGHRGSNAVPPWMRDTGTAAMVQGLAAPTTSLAAKPAWSMPRARRRWRGAGAGGKTADRARDRRRKGGGGRRPAASSRSRLRCTCLSATPGWRRRVGSPSASDLAGSGSASGPGTTRVWCRQCDAGAPARTPWSIR